jgi:hypothetical protein
MRFRGGEFSTGTTGNFQPELTRLRFINLHCPKSRGTGFFLLPRRHFNE